MSFLYFSCTVTFLRLLYLRIFINLDTRHNRTKEKLSIVVFGFLQKKDGSTTARSSLVLCTDS